MNRVLILHYHEIWLKGGNKRYFLSRLIAAIKHSLADLPVILFSSSPIGWCCTPVDEIGVAGDRRSIASRFRAGIHCPGARGGI